MPRAKRICPKPGCPRPIEGRAYCREHEREADKARGTKTQRGYGTDFQRKRRVFERALQELGTINCWRCQHPIHNGEPWHLGHDDHDRNIIRGPEHPTCNLTAAGQAAHRYERTL